MGQKREGVQKHSQIAFCKFSPIESHFHQVYVYVSYRPFSPDWRIFYPNLENQSEKPVFWHLARRMRERDIYYCTATCIDRDCLECRIDYLKITNGISEVRYCSDRLTGTDLLVSGNYVVLTFQTDLLLENKTGFEIFFAEEISSK